MKKLIIGLCIGLTGCAGAFGPNYPKFSDSQYSSYSYFMYYSETCYNLGMLEPALLAKVRQNTMTVYSAYDLDMPRLISEYKHVRETTGAPSTEKDCKDVELGAYKIIEYGQLIERNRAAQMGRPDPVSNNIVCNKIGTQTFCN